MAKTLKVIEPFFMMETGDTFELSKEGMYVSSYNSEYNQADADNSDIKASYSSNYQISPSFAKELIDNGYLEEIDDTKKSFVNVFDEIDNLLNVYNKDLNTLDEEAKDMPACLKVEKETVLRNMVKVLEHLNSLKK